MARATSADGTTIAFDRLGAGPPLVVVGGALCDRAKLRDTAEGFAAHHTVLVHDRRGRGESGDTQPYAVSREIEDVAAVVAAAGAPAAVYGHSSGAALALHAAAAGVPMTRLVLHDPPYGPAGDEQRREARAYLDELVPLLAAGRRDDAVALFLGVTGAPADLVDAWRGESWWPPMAAMAPTLRYDAEVLGYADETLGGAAPLDVAARVAPSTLVLVGGDSPAFMADVAEAIAGAIPDGRLRVLAGQDHVVPPEVLAPVVAEFLAT